MAEQKRPEGSTGDKPVPTHAAGSPPDPRQTGTQSQSAQPQQSQRPASSESHKRQIADYFRSQGKQPDDAVWEFQGLKLRLRDLD